MNTSAKRCTALVFPASPFWVGLECVLSHSPTDIMSWKNLCRGGCPIQHGMVSSISGFIPEISALIPHCGNQLGLQEWPNVTHCQMKVGQNQPLFNSVSEPVLGWVSFSSSLSGLPVSFFPPSLFHVCYLQPLWAPHNVPAPSWGFSSSQWSPFLALPENLPVAKVSLGQSDSS